MKYAEYKRLKKQAGQWTEEDEALAPEPKYKVAAKAERTWNERVYDSKAEMIRAQELDTMKHAGLIHELYEQHRFWLGDIEYIADFFVIDDDGSHVEEVKGFETREWKRIKRLWPKYGPCDLYIFKRHSKSWASREIIKGANGNV